MDDYGIADYFAAFKGRLVEVVDMRGREISGSETFAAASAFRVPTRCVDINEHGALLTNVWGNFYFTFTWPYVLVILPEVK